MVEQLKQISEALSRGESIKQVTVREFLKWFGVQRRGPNIVSWINEELIKCEITTVPDYVAAWIDGPISFATAHHAIESADGSKAADEAVDGNVLPNWIVKDPTFRISRLEAANAEVAFVGPDFKITEAITIMLLKDYSQLPVITGTSTLKGVFSWKSLGSYRTFNEKITLVRQAMDVAVEVKSDSSIFDAIPYIVKVGYVIVRGENNNISGIVTSSDLSNQFQFLTEPFLLLSEVENLIRNLIGEKFTLSKLKAAGDPSRPANDIKSVADLTFGEYVRLLEKPESWALLGLSLDRNHFCRNLDLIREIRNDVMHFDPDGIEPERLSLLRSFTNFLKTMQKLRQAPRV